MGEKLQVDRCVHLFQTYLSQKRIPLSNKPLFQHSLDILSKFRVPITSSTLAHELGLSQQHLNRLMNQQFGYSSKQFLKVHRFRACLNHMNHSPHENLSQIALEAGYFDQAHFSHEFKTMSGVSPGQYRKKLQADAFIKQTQEEMVDSILVKVDAV